MKYGRPAIFYENMRSPPCSLNIIQILQVFQGSCINNKHTIYVFNVKFATCLTKIFKYMTYIHIFSAKSL